ncbi:MAG: hypothetical protein COB07_04825 [Sulfurovum sp.]|nr:MAG: hypothetical protein COB07_04825 [Sulfurovum sp.]
MKRYLLVGIAVLFVGANASENPFALKENLAKIDQEQEVLLGELRRLAEEKELEDEVEEETATPKEASDLTAAPKPPAAESEAEVAASIDVMVTELDTVVSDEKGKPEEVVVEKKMLYGVEVQEKPSSDERAADIREKALEEARGQEAAQKAKEEQERVAKEQRETERREVEAYEKKRAEKLAKVAEEKAAAEKVAIEKAAADKLAAENTAMENTSVEKIALEPVAATEEAGGTAYADINVTREANEAKEAADLAYSQAVEEMNQED